MLADAAMAPPVTLLTYATDDPALAIFWPFAVYSPEYQAVRWAVSNSVPVSFIDVPAAWRLAGMKARKEAEANSTEDAPPDNPEEVGAKTQNGDTAGAAGVRDPDPDKDRPLESDGEDAASGAEVQLRWDPLGELARAAGYEDGESWWRDVIEENPDSGPVFAAIADAMAALRADNPLAELERPDQLACESDAVREAHMRLEIAKLRKIADGDIAVVCGAWHVPALAGKHTAKNDRALIKGFAKTKVTSTWAPWTAPRLAFTSGYGAGVVAPGWCDHLWHTARERSTSVWLARVARALREKGANVSTASIIEAERLSTALAAIRERPQPGFEELREASIACLCHGEPLLWQQIEAELLIGSEVGSIPDDVPQTPLIGDLQRQQKAVRLKPEALERELAVDLRSDSGLARSTLLHRLNALDVAWGRLTDAGRSRGTFRERWLLSWEPEYAVKLVEHLVYGSTIEQAASGRTIARIGAAKVLGALAELVLQAMTARLPAATNVGIAAIGQRAAQTSDCAELMSSLPAMADVIRYGEARDRDSSQLGDLARRIAVQAALSLPYAARALDKAAATQLCAQIAGTERAIQLIELSPADVEVWKSALRAVLADQQATMIVAGTCARLLYESEDMSAEQAAAVLSRKLSPGANVADAAAYFEGFFEGASQRLIFDGALREAVHTWVLSLDEEPFIENLPLLRRVLASLDASERRHLLDRLFGKGPATAEAYTQTADSKAAWERHFAVLTGILTAEVGDDRKP